jgi:hypothetical protein
MAYGQATAHLALCQYQFEVRKHHDVNEIAGDIAVGQPARSDLTHSTT